MKLEISEIRSQQVGNEKSDPITAVHVDKSYIAEELSSEFLVENINEGLMSVIGESATQATYYHLEKFLSLNRDEVLKNPRTFVEGLEKIFGFGSQYLEMAIVEKLYSKIGITHKEKRNYAFTDYVEEAIKQYVEKSFHVLVGNIPPLNDQKNKSANIL